MALLKPNSETIKKVLKAPAQRYTISGHEGLCLHTRGDGTGSYLVRYRVAGRRQWHTLHNDAKHAVLGAVIEAKDQWLAQIKLGGLDPKAELEKQRQKNKVEKRTLDQCFEDWVTHIGRRRQRKLAKRSEQFYRDLYKGHIQPHLGSTSIAVLTKDDVERAIEKVKRATTNEKKGRRGLQALKALKLISWICEKAIDDGDIDRNPCRNIPDPVPATNPSGKTTRAPTNEELRQLWIEGPDYMTPAATRVLRTTILLGRRISEIAEGKRKDARLDQEPGVLQIPRDRNGNKAKQDDAVPLPPMARAIIEEALDQGKDGDPLFKGASTRWTTAHEFKEFRREKKWPGHVRIHDMRTLINDQLAAMGVPGEIRSRVLHHTSDLKQLANTVYSAYDYIPERLRALTLWQARLEEIVSGGKPSGLRW